jgi:hypothetical protein
LGLAGMVGLWGIGFFSPELISTALKERPILAKDLVQPAALVQGIKMPTNSAMNHLRGLLKPEVVRQATQFNGAEVPAALQESLLNDLNRLVAEGQVYQPEAFAAVSLKKATANLVQQLAKKPQKADQIFLNRQLIEQTYPGAFTEMQKTMDNVRGKGMFLQDVGALAGMFAFTFLASVFSRRLAFLVSFAMCLATTIFVFSSLKTEMDAYWMLPLMGFAQLAVFAGYSIYFPEIYPTRLRGTGVGFCYNTVRYLAAPFPYMLGWLSTQMGFRTAAMAMSAIYLLGMVALFWAPETKGQPLPED